MNIININKNIFALAAFLLLVVACNKSEQIAPENNSNFPADGIIRVDTKVVDPQTRAGMVTEDLYRFLVKIVNENNSAYSYISLMQKNEGKWESFGQTWNAVEATRVTMLWQNKTQKIKVTARSGRDRSGCDYLWTKYGNYFDLKIYGNQDCTKLKVNDILFMKEKEIDPSKDLVNGKIPIAFNHRLSKLNITVKMGTEFNKLEGGTTTNLISKIAVQGVGTRCNWVMDSDTFTYLYVDRDVNPWNNSDAYIAGEGNTKQAEAKYECILIPQTIDANLFTVSITIGGRVFIWKSPTAIELSRDTLYNLTLVVGHDVVTLEGFSAAPWTEGEPQNIETL